MQRKTLLVSIAFRALLTCGAFAATAAIADEGQGPFPLQFVVSSTIPSNGDLNPYGIAFVPKDFPSAAHGILRSMTRAPLRKCSCQMS